MTVWTSDSYGQYARASKKEIADSTSTVQTTACYGLDARIADMEIACLRIVFRTLIPLGPDAVQPYKEITCSGRTTVRTMCHPIRTMPLNRKDFPPRNFWKILSHSCPSEQPMSTVRTAPRYILPDAHLSHQPINRGPWALRTARIRCEFH
jgi:hypothetical protein